MSTESSCQNSVIFSPFKVGRHSYCLVDRRSVTVVTALCHVQSAGETISVPCSICCGDLTSSHDALPASKSALFTYWAAVRHGISARPEVSWLSFTASTARLCGPISAWRLQGIPLMDSACPSGRVSDSDVCLTRSPRGRLIGRGSSET
jgi:hypothetical protein